MTDVRALEEWFQTLDEDTLPSSQQFYAILRDFVTSTENDRVIARIRRAIDDQFAESIGMSSEGFQRLLTGGRRISAGELAVVATVLAVPVASLLDPPVVPRG